jgi:cytochrome c-L
LECVRVSDATDVGTFAAIFGAAAGAMASFRKRDMAQEDMLKIIAYVRSLKT